MRTFAISIILFSATLCVIADQCSTCIANCNLGPTATRQTCISVCEKSLANCTLNVPMPTFSTSKLSVASTLTTMPKTVEGIAPTSISTTSHATSSHTKTSNSTVSSTTTPTQTVVPHSGGTMYSINFSLFVLLLIPAFFLVIE